MGEILKLETRLCQQMSAHNFLSLLLVVVPVLPATAVASATLSCTGLCAPPSHQVPSQSSSVAAISRQVMSEPSGTEPPGNIITAITETVLGLMKQNVRTRPLLREGIPSANPQLSDGVRNVVLEPRWVLDTKTDWPTEPCS
jgi:hypothetical protein